MKALISDLRWRIENNVDTISLADIHPLFIERGLFFFHKTDKFGRPCAVINLREYQREDGSPTIEDVKKYIIYHAEVARRLLWDKTRKSRDGPVLQYAILLDLKGAGVSTLVNIILTSYIKFTFLLFNLLKIFFVFRIWN